MILIAGVDCEPSVAMEKYLNASGVSYKILPTYLSVKNSTYAAALACASNPEGFVAQPALTADGRAVK